MVEMLFILVMLGVAGLMSARLFTASMRVIGSAPLAQDRSARVDRMSGILRKDVWNASKINCAPDAVMLIHPDGSTIRWRFTREGATRAADGAREQRWSIEPIALESTGAMLRLRSKSSPDEPMEFVSQWLRINGVAQ